MDSNETPEKLRIQPGCTITLLIQAGGEIYCLQGTASIVPAPCMQAGSLFTPAFGLRVGQAWRSENTQQVTVGNSDRMPCMIERIHLPAVAMGATRKNRLAAFATRRFVQELVRWIRRGPIAASVKTP